MTDHRITAKLNNAREIFDLDPTGQLIDDERARNRIAKVECALLCDDFRVAMSLRVLLPKDRMPKVENSDHILGWLAREALSDYISTRHPIDIFQVQEINLPIQLGNSIPDIPQDYAYMQPMELRVRDEVFVALKSQARDYDLARKAFDDAVDKLREHSGLWPEGLKARYGEILFLLNFLDDCLASADLGFMYGWYREKQATLRSSFAGLARRKNAYHKR